MNKIIQISAVHGGHSLHEIVYALDDEGNIYRNRIADNRWEKLPPTQPPQNN